MSSKEIYTPQIRFPKKIFWISFVVLLLMSGIHTGLYVLSDYAQWPVFFQINVPILYWGCVAAGLTVYIRKMTIKTYEIPMQQLAKASAKVASGDFSVYVPPVHTRDKYDYLDNMILNFDKMVEELRSIETLKTDFFANVSHEMKTPLAVISGNAELLSRPGIDEKKRAECTTAIVSASRRMNHLITNMLKLNKLEKQAIQPKPDRYDLGEQLTECVFQIDELLDQKKLELETELDERLYIRADYELMNLVWMNLLSNAIKFTPAGGTITISMARMENSISVIIADTGCGMSQEAQQHIFEKFYQGDTSHSTEGNGLGLALVKRILELSGGRITLKSTLGAGSAFTVILPPEQEDISYDL